MYKNSQYTGWFHMCDLNSSENRMSISWLIMMNEKLKSRLEGYSWSTPITQGFNRLWASPPCQPFNGGIMRRNWSMLSRDGVCDKTGFKQTWNVRSWQMNEEAVKGRGVGPWRPEVEAERRRMSQNTTLGISRTDQAMSRASATWQRGPWPVSSLPGTADRHLVTVWSQEEERVKAEACKAG